MVALGKDGQKKSRKTRPAGVTTSNYRLMDQRTAQHTHTLTEIYVARGNRTHFDIHIYPFLHFLDTSNIFRNSPHIFPFFFNFSNSFSTA